MHRRLAACHGVIIVHDHEAAGDDLVIECAQRIRRALVHVAVEPQDRELPDRRTRQRVAKPALQKAHLIVEEAVEGEIALHLLERDGKVGHRVVQIARIGGIGRGVGWGQPGKAVGDPDGAVGDGARAQDPAHQDAGAPAPDARLDQIARHVVVERGLDAETQVLHPRAADHAVGDRGPVLPRRAQLRHIEPRASPFAPQERQRQRRIEIDLVEDRAQQEIDIRVARNLPHEHLRRNRAD